MADVDVSSTQHPGHLVAALRGELDICDTAGLGRALSAAAGSGSSIIVDLAGLTFSDCGSLSASACAREKARQAGGDLVLAAPQRQVLRVLSLTFLIDRLPVFASVEEAADGGRRLPAGTGLAPEQADGEAPPGNGEVDPARRRSITGPGAVPRVKEMHGGRRPS